MTTGKYFFMRAPGNGMDIAKPVGISKGTILQCVLPEHREQPIDVGTLVVLRHKSTRKSTVRWCAIGHRREKENPVWIKETSLEFRVQSSDSTKKTITEDELDKYILIACVSAVILPFEGDSCGIRWEEGNES